MIMQTFCRVWKQNGMFDTWHEPGGDVCPHVDVTNSRTHT